MNQNNNEKNKVDSVRKFIEVDFGTRKIITQNFSKLVTIPKIALLNWNQKEAKFVNVKLVQEDDEKYIKLTPIYDCSLEII